MKPDRSHGARWNRRGVAHSRRRSVFATSLLLLFALILAACGGAADDPATDDAGGDAGTDDEDSGEDAGEDAGEDDGGSAAPGEGCEGSSITLGTNGDANNFNPILAVDSDGYWRSDLIFSPMVLIDPVDQGPIPNLATSWEISDDGLTYTFELDERARFHDGEPLTAEDVEFTLLEMLQPDYTGAYQSYWSRLAGAAAVIDGSATTLEGIEVIDDHTISLTLEEPYAGFLTVAVRELKPLPKHLLEGTEITTEAEFTSNPVGSGRYEFVSWDPGNRFEVAAWDDYWGDEPTCMQSIIQEVILDQNTLQQGVLSGQLDASIVIAPSGMETMRNADGLVAHTIEPRFGEAIWYNTRNEPWGDPTLRRAVAAAVDWMAFQREFMYEPEPVPPHIVSYGSWAYDAEAGKIQEYDPDLAAELFEEAGYGDGGLEFTILTNQGNQNREASQVYLQQAMAEYGHTVNIETLAWGEFIAEIRAGTFDVAALSMPAAIPDPTLQDFMLTTDGPTNYGGWSNAEADALLVEAGRELDLEKRKELYSQVQALFAEDLPWVPNAWYPNTLVINEKFQNVEPSVIHALWNIHELSVAE
jgi:peptide/nickel transport system substrate-binding protein